MNTNVQDQITSLEEQIAELQQQLASMQDTATFTRIECHELRIVSDAGEPLVTISSHEELESGIIRVFDTTGQVLVSLCGEDQGGSIAVCPSRKASPNPEEAVSIEMFVDDHGNGCLHVCNNEGDRLVALSVARPALGSAGCVTVHGALDTRERVVIGCNPETDNGSLKTYSNTGYETDSLTGEPCDLRLTGLPSMREYQHLLRQIEEKLQGETDEDQRCILSVKKSEISELISQAKDNTTP